MGKMEYQDQILEFLKKPENLSIALEVMKHLEEMRPYLHQAFWKDIQKGFEARLENSTFADRWIIDTWGNFEGAYCNLRIRIKSIPDTFKGTCLSVGLMQGNQKDYQLHYGLIWDGKDGRLAPNSAAYQTLMMLSKTAGFYEKDQNQWWPACRYLGIFLRSYEFMQRYGIQPTEFIGGLVEKIWDYFVMLEPSLYELNQEIFGGR
jgi:hypothetical protein